MGTGIGEVRTEQSWGGRDRAARVRGKSEEQGGKGQQGAGMWQPGGWGPRAGCKATSCC